MCQRKRGPLQIGIILTSMVLFLVLAAWVPVSLAYAQEVTLKTATPNIAMVQTTPTEDATVTALNKEKLAQEVQQLKDQNEPDFFGRIQANATLLSTILVLIGGLIGLWRWSADRRGEREKRAEERFQAAVTWLSDDKEGARIGAAVLLRTFLRPGYQQFYIQVFDLAVANLCLPREAHTSEDPDGYPNSQVDPDTPSPLTTLRRALIVVFKESFPLARRQLTRNLHWRKRLGQSLDASGINLDNAYLRHAYLRQIWMPGASLRNANLSSALLGGAILHDADLRGADFFEADLKQADLRGAKLHGVKNIEQVKSLFLTDLREVEGLDEKLLASCQKKGALISTTNASPSTVAPPSLSQSNNGQILSEHPAAGSPPSSNPDRSNIAPSQRELEP